MLQYFRIITAMAVLAVPAMAQSTVRSLEDCRSMALAQNKKIKAAQAQVAAAQAAGEAANRNSLPSFDASLMGIHVGEPLNKLLPSVIGSATVSVSQPIYAGGKIKLGKEASAKAIELYQGQQVLEESEVLLAVENAYWQLVQIKEKVVLANTYKQMLLALHRDLQHAVNAGLIYKNDLLRADVSLNEAELNIIKANDGLVLAKLSLAQVTGQPGDTAFTIADTVSGSFGELAEPSPDDAADKRPEISILRKAIEVEQLQGKIIRADLRPQIGLSLAGIGSAGDKINFSNGKDYLVSYYGVASISMPLFDWGKNAKKVKEQGLKIQARQWQLESHKEQIDLQVQHARMQLSQSVRKISLSTLSQQQAEENLRLTNDHYKAGTITGKDVLEAQAIWQQAYAAMIDAKAEYKMNMANYKKATGELK